MRSSYPHHRFIFPWLLAVGFAGALGCGSGGGNESSGGGGGEGGTSVGSPQGGGGANSGGSGAGGEQETCDCSLTTPACGSRIEQEALSAGCTVPLLPDQRDSLLACDAGTWRVHESCATTCIEATASDGDACASALPSISMEHAVVQAQVEPFRGDQPMLPGDVAVERVQQALADEGFAASVDGWFGNETAARYTDWQMSLGHTGLAANGVPGPMSLAALGAGRFLVTDLVVVGPRTTYGTKTVNDRTRAMLAEADAMLPHDLRVTQGSYNAGGVSASAGTHDGGGTVDVSVLNLSTTARWETIQTMRRVGFAAWLRTPNQGNWPYHIHAVAVGDTDVSNSARNQVADYYVGRNGLSSHAADNTPANYQVPFTWWEQYLRTK